MVEIRKLLTSAKYILRIVKRDLREVHIQLMSTKMDFVHDQMDLRNVVGVEVGLNDKEQFTIVMRDGTRTALYT